MTTTQSSHPPGAVDKPAVPAIPHFRQSFLTPQECAEHTEWVRLAKLYHPCPDCAGGLHTIYRCRTCQGRGFLLPRAVARKWGLEAVLLPAKAETVADPFTDLPLTPEEEAEGFYLAGTWRLDDSDLAAMAEARERAAFEADPVVIGEAQLRKAWVAA